MKNLWLFVLIALAMISSCQVSDEQQCNEPTKTFTVNLWNCRVEYKLDTNVTDVSAHLGIRNWGPESIKEYYSDKDTLTFSWYDDYNGYNDSEIKKVLENIILKDSMTLCKHSITKIDLNEMSGMYYEAICDGQTKLVFFGKNASTKKVLLAENKYKSGNAKSRNRTFCILNSMTFLYLPK